MRAWCLTDAPLPAAPPARKGASRIADVPRATLAALEAGEDESRTLTEWLAIDVAALARAALPGSLVGDARAPLLAAAREAAKLGATRRHERMGAALHGAFATDAARGRVFRALATHRSDTVRMWAANMVLADATLPLATRLDAARRFAQDPNMSVREIAWTSFRPHIVAELPRALALLAAWTRDPHEGIRRCAVEGTRPRGVWTQHIPALRDDPDQALGLLEPVRSDPSLYVRKALANWINDASKSRPDWARALCARWTRESPTPETAWIVKRGLRTLSR